MGPTEDTAFKASSSSSGGWKSWTAKKKALVVGSVLLVIIALAVGLGVGLGVGLNHGGDDDNDNDNDNPNESPGPGGNHTDNTGIWQPAVGTSWQIVLRYPLNDTAPDVDVYDIDLFDNTKETFDRLHDLDRKVICYFSAGTYEDWRPDASKFRSDDIGDALPDWEGESWVNISSPSIRDIMTSRLDIAVDKGCDGVDPDNVDGYDNRNGLDLTEDDTVDFMTWLGGEAHGRNLSIGLKNAGAVIPRVIADMQWSVNEQCAEYEECDVYAQFPQNDKPVFHIEYPKGDNTNNLVNVSATRQRAACDFEDSRGFSTVIKNMDLDNWIQYCP